MARGAVLGLVFAIWCGAAAAQSAYDDVPALITPSTCSDSTEDWAQRALHRSLTPQLGLPPLPHPVDNPPTAAKIELGRKLPGGVQRHHSCM